MLPLVESAQKRHSFQKRLDFIHFCGEEENLMDRNTAPKTDNDPIVLEENAAITADNLKIEAETKAEVRGEPDKAENAIRELSRPIEMPVPLTGLLSKTSDGS